MGDGSSQAMDTFLASVERRAYRIARTAVGNTEDALDIVQDAMFALVKRYAHKPVSDWKPLFYRILMNRIRDGHRRKTFRDRWQTWLRSIRKGARAEGSDDPDPIESLPAPEGRNPDAQVMVGDAMAALDRALQVLPLRQRQAFFLRAWEGFSVRETAAAMNCTPGSVKTHYYRAVHSLRDQLGEHWP